MSRYHGYSAEPRDIVAGLTATVTRTGVGLMRGLARQMVDFRMHFPRATWRGDLVTALRAEAAWDRLAGQMSNLRAYTAGQGPDRAGEWLRAFRLRIDEVAEIEAADYRAQYDF